MPVGRLGQVYGKRWLADILYSIRGPDGRLSQWEIRIVDISPQAQSTSVPIERYMWIVLAAWTVVVASSLLWNARQVGRDTLELARLQARIGHTKDVLYRRWNTRHGPVYVAQTEKTPANPYLAGIPERDIVTPSGKRLTMMNPAYMTRQVHEITEKAHGARGHITSLNPIRRENAADPWENKALKALHRGETEVSEVRQMDGQDYMRLIRPLVTEPGCLKCHAAQGYRAGDIRGGISVSVPMAPLWSVKRRYMSALSAGHALIWLVGVVGIGIGGRRLRASRNAIELKNVQLAQRGRELQAAHDALDAELRSVGEVQISLLPTRVPDMPGFEGVTHYRPAKRAGGDYFDFFPLPDGQWGVLVADVSGHGAPAAVVMAMTHVILHLTPQKAPPEYVLSRLNEVLITKLQDDQFVAACYGVLTPTTRTLCLASAGHPHPLFFERLSGSAGVRVIDYGLPLGVVENAEYATSSIVLDDGDVLLFYTDGITEAHNCEREQFGQDRLRRVLGDHGAGSGEALREAVLTALDEHRRGVELADDITLLILRALQEPR